MILVRNRRNAPAARWYSPLPKSKPNTVSGGSKATATITPITTAGAPVVNARTPAAPEARASSISEIPVWVREAISGMPGSIVKKKPMAEDKKMTSENPAIVAVLS